MAKYGVPIWMRIQGLVVVEAENAAEAKQKVKEGKGSLVADDSNWLTHTLRFFAGIRRETGQKTPFDYKGVRKLTDDEAKRLDAWDNDKGVPW